MLDPESVESICWFLIGTKAPGARVPARTFIAARLADVAVLCTDASPLHTQCAAYFYAFGRYAKSLGALWKLLPLALADVIATQAGAFLRLDAREALTMLVNIARQEMTFEAVNESFAPRIARN